MKRRALAIVLGAALAAWLPGAAFAQHAEGPAVHNGDSITLAIGETKTISAKDVRNYSEGASGIIDIRLTTDGGQFVITGRRQGSTTLLLIKADGTQNTVNIDVFQRSPEAVERELAQLLDGLPNARVRRVGSHIVIDGTVADQEELKRVQHVASLYPGEVDSLASVAGVPPSTAPNGPGPAPELPRFLIRIDFYFVQYDTNYSYNVGISWPGTIGGPFVQASLTYDFLDGVPRAATASIANQPLPGLDIASTKGWAKVLRQATVITNNGIEATFANGGEENFSVTTGIGVGIQRIPFGTDLTVLPRYLPQAHQIDVKLSAEVSDLTAAVNGTNLPGRQHVEAHDQREPQARRIARPLRDPRASPRRTPSPGSRFLKDIPVLGILFGSHSDDSELTEGAIFIVPSVIEPAPNATRELVTNALATFRNFSGNMDSLNTFESHAGRRRCTGPQVTATH